MWSARDLSSEEVGFSPLMVGWHRRWPGRPAKTLLHATVKQKGFRFAPALSGLKSPFFLYARFKEASRNAVFGTAATSLATRSDIY